MIVSTYEEKGCPSRIHTWFGVFDQAFHSMLDFKVKFTVLGVLLAKHQKLVEQWIIGWVAEILRKCVKPNMQSTSQSSTQKAREISFGNSFNG